MDRVYATVVGAGLYTAASLGMLAVRYRLLASTHNRLRAPTVHSSEA